MACMTPWQRQPWHWRTGAQMALGFTQVCTSPSDSSRTDTVHGQRGWGTCPASCAVGWPGTGFPNLCFFYHSPSWRISLRKDLLSQGPGTMWHPCPDLGTSICGSWMRHGRLQCFCPLAVEDSLRPEPSPRGDLLPWSWVCSRSCVLLAEKTPKVHDWSSAFFPAGKIGS